MGGISGRKSKPWYAEGLHFDCLQCGQCCGGAPGCVYVSEEDLRIIADYLNMPVEDFTAQCLRKIRRGFSLIERAGGDCIMLQDKKCRIYPVRPTQCRTWPFWPSNLAGPRAWQRAARRCPGIGSGPLHTFEEIETCRKALKIRG